MSSHGFSLGEPPTPGGAPPPQTGGMDSLVGQEGTPGQGNQESATRGFVTILRSMMEQLEDASRQFPVFGKFAKNAQEQIKEGMMRVISQQSPTGQQSPLPKVVG